MKPVRYLNYLVDRARLTASKRRIAPDVPAVRQVAVDGCRLLVLANEDVGRQIHVLGRYESADLDCLVSRIAPGDICFDVGANTGFVAVRMAAAARDARVVAFEPLPLNYHLVCANALLNDLPIRAVQCAVSDAEGEASFSQAQDSAYSSLLPVGRKAEARKISVAMVTLADFMQREGIPRIDVLKLDVEGAEERALRGAAAVLSDPARAPRLVMIELYDANLHAFGTSIGAVVELMRGFGYAGFVCHGRGRTEPLAERHYNRNVNVFFGRHVDR